MRRKKVNHLQVGMGIKGGIARKILKIMVGVPKDASHMKAEVTVIKDKPMNDNILICCRLEEITT